MLVVTLSLTFVAAAPPQPGDAFKKRGKMPETARHIWQVRASVTLAGTVESGRSLGTVEERDIDESCRPQRVTFEACMHLAKGNKCDTFATRHHDEFEKFKVRLALPFVSGGPQPRSVISY